MQLGAVVIVPVIVACLLLAFADIIYVFVVYGRQESYKLYLRPTTWHLEIECFFKGCKMEVNFKMKRKVKIMLGWAYFWGIQLSNDKLRYDRTLKICQWSILSWKWYIIENVLLSKSFCHWNIFSGWISRTIGWRRRLWKRRHASSSTTKRCTSSE